MPWSYRGGEADIGAAISELESPTTPDRVAAIVGAALIESRLRDLVLSRFPVDGQTRDGLFKSTGPLGSFDVQIRLAYTLGTISKLALQDMRAIADVRNLFAHHLAIQSFEHPKVKSHCLSFKLPADHVSDADSPVPGKRFSGVRLLPRMDGSVDVQLSESGLDDLKTNPRAMFLISVKLIYSALTPYFYDDDGNPTRISGCLI